jgi:hypothetical protein
MRQCTRKYERGTYTAIITQQTLDRMRYNNTVEKNIRKLKCGQYRVNISRYNRKGLTNINISSPRLQTLEQAKEWRDAHIPDRLPSGPKSTGISKSREHVKSLWKARYNRLKAEHRCASCTDKLPDGWKFIACHACKMIHSAKRRCKSANKS